MKANRHSMILQLVETHDIETQDELADLLNKQGVKATQATISRDIRDLRLFKVLTSDGKYKYSTVENAETGMYDRLMQIFNQSVVSVKTGGNLIVIKTIAGSANVAAEAIDNLKYKEVIGTIAGDNTIFVAIEDQSEAEELAQRFRALLR